MLAAEPVHAADEIPQSTPMIEGKRVDTPSGYTSFCGRFPNQCTVSFLESKRIKLTPELWAEMETVNTAVNSSITEMEDAAHYGRVEYWTIPTDGMGDCEDYALTKRRALSKFGVSMRALRLTIVLTGGGEPHTVLTIVTDKGDYVLDNLSNSIIPWEETGYAKWGARQNGSGNWVELKNEE